MIVSLELANIQQLAICYQLSAVRLIPCAVQPLNHRVIEPSAHRAIEPSGHRVIE
jgi:hypothetical protein